MKLKELNELEYEIVNLYPRLKSYAIKLTKNMNIAEDLLHETILKAVENPITIFEKILYDDKERDMHLVDVSDLDNKFVKVIVINKTKPAEFEKFLDRINFKKIHGLQIAENFQDFVGSNVEDSKINVDSTDDLLYTYIDAVDTDLSKDRIKKQVRELMIEAQTLEVV